MINIENFLNSISNKIPTGFTFSPSDTDLDNYFQKKINNKNEDFQVEFELKEKMQCHLESARSEPLMGNK